MREIIIIHTGPDGTHFGTKYLENYNHEPDIYQNNCNLSDDFIPLNYTPIQCTEVFVNQFAPRVVMMDLKTDSFDPDYADCIFDSNNKKNNNNNSNMASGDQDPLNSRPNVFHIRGTHNLLDQSLELIRSCLSVVAANDRWMASLLQNNTSSAEFRDRVCSTFSTFPSKVYKRDILMRSKPNSIAAKQQEEEDGLKKSDPPASTLSSNVCSWKAHGTKQCQPFIYTTGCLLTFIPFRNSHGCSEFMTQSEFLQGEMFIRIEGPFFRTATKLDNVRSIISLVHKIILARIIFSLQPFALGRYSNVKSNRIVSGGNNANSTKDKPVYEEEEEDDKEERLQLLLSLLRRSEQELAEGFVQELWSMRELILFQRMPSTTNATDKTCSSLAQSLVEKSGACDRSRSPSTNRSKTALSVSKTDAVTQTRHVRHGRGSRRRRPLRISSDPLPRGGWSRNLNFRPDHRRSSTVHRDTRLHYLTLNRTGERMTARNNRNYPGQKALNSDQRLHLNRHRSAKHYRISVPVRIPYSQILSAMECVCLQNDTVALNIVPHLGTTDHCDKIKVERNINLLFGSRRITRNATTFDQIHSDSISVRPTSGASLRRSLSDRKEVAGTVYHVPERAHVKAMRLRSGDLRAELPVQHRWSVLGYMSVLSHSSSSVTDQPVRSVSMDPMANLVGRRRAILWKFSKPTKDERIRENAVATWYANNLYDDKHHLDDDESLDNELEGLSLGSSQSASQMQKIPDDDGTVDFPVDEFYREAGINIIGWERPVISRRYRYDGHDEASISQISGEILSSSATNNQPLRPSRVEDRLGSAAERLSQVQQNQKLSTTASELQPVSSASQVKREDELRDLLPPGVEKKVIAGGSLPESSSAVRESSHPVTLPEVVENLRDAVMRKSLKKRRKVLSSKQKESITKSIQAKMSLLKRQSQGRRSSVSSGIIDQIMTEPRNSEILKRALYDLPRDSKQYSKDVPRSSKGSINQAELKFPASTVPGRDSVLRNKAKAESLATKRRTSLDATRSSRKQPASTSANTAQKTAGLQSTNDHPVTDENPEQRRSVKLNTTKPPPNLHGNLQQTGNRPTIDRLSISSIEKLYARNNTRTSTSGPSDKPPAGKSVGDTTNETRTTAVQKGPGEVGGTLPKTGRPSVTGVNQTKLDNEKPETQVLTTAPGSKLTTTARTSINQIRPHRKSIPSSQKNQVTSESGQPVGSEKAENVTENVISSKQSSQEQVLKDAVDGEAVNPPKDAIISVAVEEGTVIPEDNCETMPPMEIGPSFHEDISLNAKTPSPSLPQTPSNTTEINEQDQFQRSSGLFRTSSTADAENQVPLEPEGPKVSFQSEDDLQSKDRPLHGFMVRLSEKLQTLKTAGRKSISSDRGTLKTQNSLVDKQQEPHEPENDTVNHIVPRSTADAHEQPNINGTMKRSVSGKLHFDEATQLVLPRPNSKRQPSASDMFRKKSSQQSGDFSQLAKISRATSSVSARTTGTVLTTLSNGSSEAEFRDEFLAETNFILPPY